MNTILKNIATTTVLLLSLASTTAFANGNHGKNPIRRNANPPGAGMRGASSGTRSVMLQHGDFASFQSHTMPHADGLILERRGRTARSTAPGSTASRLSGPTVNGFFKSSSGLSYETEVVARPGSRKR